MDDLRQAMAGLSESIQKVVMSRAVNEATDRKARVLAKRSIIATGRFKPSYVHERIKTQFARSGSAEPEATVDTTTDKWSTILQFKPRFARRARGPWRVYGNKIVGAQPWGESRDYKGVFLIRGKNGRDIPVVRENGKLKGVYGPAPARELKRALERAYSGPDILVETGRYLEVRLRHHINQAAQAEKSRYNL